MIQSSRAIAFVAAAMLAGACALVLDVDEVHYESVDGAASDGNGGAGADASADVAADAFDPCDFDRDGVRAIGACGGSDCDDTDPRVHPGAGFVTDLPPSGKTGDWDCDGVVTKQFRTSFLGCVSFPCDTDAGGYIGEVACGASAEFRSCLLDDGGCDTVGTFETRTQGCR